MVPACYKCPFEGQIYEFNIDSTKPVCACQVDEWKSAAGKCINQEFTGKFTEGNSQYSESIASQITYNAVETESADGLWTVSPQQHSSGTIQYYYLDAAVGCTEFGDVQKCQLLANLCVMQMYASGVICDLYRDTVQQSTAELADPDYYADKGFKKGVMPWLFYEENALQVIQKPNRVQFRASFSY